MNRIKKNFLLYLVIITGFSLSAEENSQSNLGISIFSDYENIFDFLNEKKDYDERASTLLSNVKLYSIDYAPSSFIRLNRPNPSFPSQLVRDGIEGYAEVTFVINSDGSTIDHFISDSQPKDYFDSVSLESAKNLRYLVEEGADNNIHSYRFTYKLNERSRKVPNAYFTCLNFIKAGRFLDAKNCAEKRNTFSDKVVGDAYKIIIAEADYYLGNKEKAIILLKEMLSQTSQESFYLKAMAITNLTTFLFNEERFSEILELEDAVNIIRKLGYEEQLIDTHYFMGISHFYTGNMLEALFFLKLSMQDTNCKQTNRLERGESFIDWKKNSLFRLVPDKVCYIDFYARSVKTLEAINKVI